jgi:hypothetical protein
VLLKVAISGVGEIEDFGLAEGDGSGKLERGIGRRGVQGSGFLLGLWQAGIVGEAVAIPA